MYSTYIFKSNRCSVIFPAFLGASYLHRICEGQLLTLNCRNAVIDTLSASYGRTRQGLCERNDGSTNCHAGTSMRVTRFECQQQHRCFLYAKNSAFGDPCKGTKKYLEVSSELNYYNKLKKKEIFGAAASEPEANKRGSSLISRRLHYRGLQSLSVTKRMELWLCAIGRFRMQSGMAQGIVVMGE